MDEKNIEDQLIDTLAKEMQEEIDWDILTDILNNTLGWTKIKITFKSNEHTIKVINWINENCKGEFKTRSGTFLFENKQDAEWFILRWL